LQSSHLSVIQGLNFFSIHDRGTFTHVPPSGYAPANRPGRVAEGERSLGRARLRRCDVI